jgi:hypothetical protein
VQSLRWDQIDFESGTWTKPGGGRRQGDRVLCLLLRGRGNPVRHRFPDWNVGHTQVQTTHRYAHLIDDHLRQATERVGAIVSPSKTAEIIKLRG